jgi:multisubunit Na+/H+ antiporter MnhF subunit
MAALLHYSPHGNKNGRAAAGIAANSNGFLLFSLPRSGEIGSIDNYESSKRVRGFMINIWLSAAVITGILAVCTVIRVIPLHSRNDRLVAGIAALTSVTTAALALSVFYLYYGNLIILDSMIVIALICFGAMIWGIQRRDGEGV